MKMVDGELLPSVEELPAIGERVTIHRVVKDNPDSIEIGTAGRGAAVKIYGSFDRPEEFKEKIRRAKELRQFAVLEFG